tara:strand:+ start:728 stop:1594 length:867 start_codon:yes stop_codon:yes gene_type:complete
MSFEITEAGYEVWFTIGRQVDPVRLLAELERITGEKRYVPEKRSKLDSLQCTLSDHCKEKSSGVDQYFVRCLSKQQGREIYREVKGIEENEITPLFTAKADDHFITLSGEQQWDRQSIQGGYDQYRESLGPKQVNTILERELSRINGTRIEGKRAWFLPPENFGRWMEIVKAVQSSTNSNDSCFYEQEYKLTGSALEAVQTSVTDEIIGTVDGILLELSEGQFTDRVAHNRLTTLDEIHDKMIRYEELFKTGLDSCRHKMSEVVQAMTFSTAVDTSDEAADELFDVTV